MSNKRFVLNRNTVPYVTDSGNHSIIYASCESKDLRTWFRTVGNEMRRSFDSATLRSG